MNIWFYLISCRFEEDSLIVGRVALNLSVGLRCLKVRVDSFQTSLWRCATVVSLLYLSNWFTTIPRQLTKLLDGIWKIASKIDEPWWNYSENTYHGIIVKNQFWENEPMVHDHKLLRIVFQHSFAWFKPKVSKLNQRNIGWTENLLATATPQHTMKV